MKENMTSELLVGIFILCGIISITFLALKMGNVDFFSNKHYSIHARFVSASGLKEGAFVEMAGVPVGKVKSIIYNPEEYLAIVTFIIEKQVQIPDDAIASIRTSGIIGDKFVKITAGGSPDYLESGMEIIETEPSINLEELISKYIFESGD